MTESGVPPLHQLAESKMNKVLGEEKGRSLLRSLLEELRLDMIRTSSDLDAVGRALESGSGFLPAIGAVLRFQALLSERDRIT